ncbi:MAG: alpha/beta fold hydrolase, partial [Actinomycetota bacterium]
SWAIAPRGTHEGLLRAGPLRRLARSLRAWWVRAILWWASWPHVIDVILRVHRAAVEPTDSDVVWTNGRVSLRRIRNGAARGTPVLIVHALVSQPWILDLATGHSLVGALSEAGLDVFVLDWGEPTRADAGRGMAAYAADLLVAEERVSAESGSPKLHLLGYCSGATLCLVRLGGWDHGRVASFAAVAPPVDLAVPGGMTTAMGSRWLKPVLMLDGDGCLPAATIRESFHMLRPEALRTVGRAFRRRRNPAFRRVYDPLSRWAYEQRRIPGGLFFDSVELHRTNALFEGGLEVDGRKIDLSRVAIPVLIAIALRDHIVPVGSSLALASVVQAETVICPGGHVSMLSGERGRQVLWPGLCGFFALHGSHGRPATRARTAAGRVSKDR